MKDAQGEQPLEEERRLRWLWECGDISLLPENICRSELTYEAVMDYLKQQQATNGQIQRGVVLREKRAEGIYILQMFLDGDSQPVYAPEGHPYGRRLLAQALSQQLNILFGSKDVLLLDQRPGSETNG